MMELATERLRLRLLTAADEEAVYSLLSDDRVLRSVYFPNFDRERTRKFVARYRQPVPPAAKTPGQITLGIVERHEPGVVGLCGLEYRPQIEEGEVWYALRPERWGRGLATEAVRAMVAHGFGPLALHRIHASCIVENPASARVLEKLGFRREGLTRQNIRIQGEWRDGYLYAILAGEWPPADDPGAAAFDPAGS